MSPHTFLIMTACVVIVITLAPAAVATFVDVQTGVHYAVQCSPSGLPLRPKQIANCSISLDGSPEANATAPTGSGVSSAQYPPSPWSSVDGAWGALWLAAVGAVFWIVRAISKREFLLIVKKKGNAKVGVHGQVQLLDRTVRQMRVPAAPATNDVDPDIEAVRR